MKKVQPQLIVLFLIGACFFYTNSIKSRSQQSGANVNLKNIPLEIETWGGVEFSFDENVLKTLKADQVMNRRYINEDGKEIWLYIGYWDNQKYGAQPHSPIQCLPGSGWNIETNEISELQDASGKFPVNLAAISNGDIHQLMLYWYQTQSGHLAEEVSIKYDLAKNALSGKATNAAIIRITASVGGGNKQEYLALLQEFWLSISPHINQFLAM